MPVRSLLGATAFLPASFHIPAAFFSVQQQKLGFETCLSLIASRVAQTLPADTVSTPVQTFTSLSNSLQTHPAYPASLWALISAEPCSGPPSRACGTLRDLRVRVFPSRPRCPEHRAASWFSPFPAGPSSPSECAVVLSQLLNSALFPAGPTVSADRS